MKTRKRRERIGERKERRAKRTRIIIVRRKEICG
jgi:hypothetical protein